MIQKPNDSDDLLPEINPLDRSLLPEYLNRSHELYPRNGRLSPLENYQQRPDPVVSKQYYKENQQIPSQKELQINHGRASPYLELPKKPTCKNS